MLDSSLELLIKYATVDDAKRISYHRDTPRLSHEHFAFTGGNNFEFVDNESIQRKLHFRKLAHRPMTRFRETAQEHYNEDGVDVGLGSADMDLDLDRKNNKPLFYDYKEFDALTRILFAHKNYRVSEDNPNWEEKEVDKDGEKVKFVVPKNANFRISHMLDELKFTLHDSERTMLVQRLRKTHFNEQVTISHLKERFDAVNTYAELIDFRNTAFVTSPFMQTNVKTLTPD